MFRFLATFHIVESGTKFFKQFKFAHKVKNADYVFSDKKQKVYAPKFDGCNPFGGIMVNRSEFDSDEEYEVMRQKIIDGLAKKNIRIMINDTTIRKITSTYPIFQMPIKYRFVTWCVKWKWITPLWLIKEYL